MLKKLSKVFFLIALLSFSMVLAESELELVAPGGGEADLRKNKMNYYADGSNLAVANWGNFVLEAKLLEYRRGESKLDGKGMVKLTQKEPFRMLWSEQIFADLNQDYFIANGAVKVRYDEITDFNGERLDWESQTERFKLTGAVTVNYSEWKMTGEKVEGNLNTGLFVIYGSVQAINMENSIRAGRIIFDRPSDKMTLLENPVVINGKNELSATEIVYDFKTKKVSASGVVKSRVIE